MPHFLKFGLGFPSVLSIGHVAVGGYGFKIGSSVPGGLQPAHNRSTKRLMETLCLSRYL